MKKILILLLLVVASVAVKAQAQYFCKSYVQTSSDSWSIAVNKDASWSARGPIEYRVTIYTNTGATIGSWQPFYSGQVIASSGLGGTAVIEIRILNLLTGAVLSQFEVTTTC
ncbi:hypothetical protein [Chitinophaga sp. Cy-1792]|uniref:hypothetical protein n=1 Tax=Chitinophaga sp. Cy-1792 TaxID=2608339 RepID=UPI00141F6CA2|nr:hypothetical protein [Chitinophaga sp. Cy-1792]NIG55743.1 hypothetical protein [Chitinophaga sp. Cy-1792]